MVRRRGIREDVAGRSVQRRAGWPDDARTRERESKEKETEQKRTSREDRKGEQERGSRVERNNKGR
jgi:uncharacterized protein YjcR